MNKNSPREYKMELKPKNIILNITPKKKNKNESLIKKIKNTKINYKLIGG